MRTSTIFRSRWMALVWAAGIIWFAYDVASSEPQGETATANAGQPNEAGATQANEIADELNRL